MHGVARRGVAGQTLGGGKQIDHRRCERRCDDCDVVVRGLLAAHRHRARRDRQAPALESAAEHHGGMGGEHVADAERLVIEVGASFGVHRQHAAADAAHDGNSSGSTHVGGGGVSDRGEFGTPPAACWFDRSAPGLAATVAA
jgi:hypothetical protein